MRTSADIQGASGPRGLDRPRRAALSTRIAPALVAFLAGCLAVTSGALGALPAQAQPGFPAPMETFGGAPSSGTPVAAMAGDGTVVIGRDVPGDSGGLQVLVRHQGGPWGATTTIEHAAPGIDPWGLQVVGGSTGSLAAVWHGGAGRGYRVAVRPSGASAWLAPRSTSVRPAVGGVVLDDQGRLWVAGVSATGTPRTMIQVFAPDQAPQTLTLPAPVGGQRDVMHQLIVTADGVGRLAYVNEQYFAGDVDVPCHYQGDLMVADLRIGASVKPRRLESRSGTGDRSAHGGGACFVADGDLFSDLRLARGSDGVTTLLSSTTRYPAGLSAVTARRVAARASWQSATARPAIGYAERTVVGAAAVGTRVVALLSGAYGIGPVSMAVQGPTGAWTAPRLLETQDSADIGIAGGPRGGLIAWRQVDDPYGLRAQALKADASLGPAQTLRGTIIWTLGQVGVDNDGNGVVAYLPGDRTPERVLPYDASGPRVTSLRVPKRVRAGKAIHLRAAAVDVWSGVSGYRWKIRKQVRTGAHAKVVLRKPGRARVVLKVTDTRGNTTTVQRTIRVLPGKKKLRLN